MHLPIRETEKEREREGGMKEDMRQSLLSFDIDPCSWKPPLVAMGNPKEVVDTDFLVVESEKNPADIFMIFSRAQTDDEDPVSTEQEQTIYCIYSPLYIYIMLYIIVFTWQQYLR